MERRLFGTDGVRGLANTHPMTAEVALALGKAAGQRFLRGDHRHRVVIGKDTRLSGYMLEPALTAGFVSAGMNVMLVGPMPTPAVAFLTRSLRADLGVMISASHNPYHDNGIKLFGPDGFKLSDEIEDEIETLMAATPPTAWRGSADLGRAKRIDDARGRYIENLKSSFPKGLTLNGLKIVVDSAHGAAYHLAADLFFELGADVVRLGTEPNGLNINDGCGSNEPALLRETVLREGADLGVALDGDADRLVLVDDRGDVIDGDQVLGLIAGSWRDDRLPARRGRGRHGHVESRAGDASGRARSRPAPHQGRRPLRGRADARRRLQCRRRAVGPHHPVRLRHHRRRPARRPPGPGRDPPARPAGVRGRAGVRAGAAAAAQRARAAAAGPCGARRWLACWHGSRRGWPAPGGCWCVRRAPSR